MGAVPLVLNKINSTFFFDNRVFPNWRVGGFAAWEFFSGRAFVRKVSSTDISAIFCIPAFKFLIPLFAKGLGDDDYNFKVFVE